MVFLVVGKKNMVGLMYRRIHLIHLNQTLRILLTHPIRPSQIRQPHRQHHRGKKAGGWSVSGMWPGNIHIRKLSSSLTPRLRFIPVCEFQTLHWKFYSHHQILTSHLSQRLRTILMYGRQNMTNSRWKRRKRNGVMKNGLILSLGLTLPVPVCALGLEQCGSLMIWTKLSNIFWIQVRH